MAIIYKIENKVNENFYVGKTIKALEDRWRTHLYDFHGRPGNSKLYKAFKKYGLENFEMYEIEECSNETVDEREKYWIEVLEPPYNITKGGTGGCTRIPGRSYKGWKVKDTSRMRNKKTVTQALTEGRKKLAGGNNYQSKYKIYTPWGVFETWKAASEAAKVLKNEGQDVITMPGTIMKYSLNNILLSKEGRRTPAEWRGKYTKDLGFFVELK